MSRAPRRLVEGGVYHAYNRFAPGEEVFADPEGAVAFPVELLVFYSWTFSMNTQVSPLSRSSQGKRSPSSTPAPTRAWGAWVEIVPDQVMTAAILDRLLHRSVTINIQGESYRLRKHRKAGLSPLPIQPKGGDDTPPYVSNRNR